MHLQLLHFALEGWHSQEPLPFYQAPNSLLGRLVIGPMIMYASCSCWAHTYHWEQTPQTQGCGVRRRQGGKSKQGGYELCLQPCSWHSGCM